jgi:hypothetical protein
MQCNRELATKSKEIVEETIVRGHYVSCAMKFALKVS